MSSTTDTREKGLETLIAKSLIHEAGCLCGNPAKYDHEYCVDLAQLSAFLRVTAPEVAEALALGEDGPTRRRFLARLQGEIAKRGIPVEDVPEDEVLEEFVESREMEEALDIEEIQDAKQ